MKMGYIRKFVPEFFTKDQLILVSFGSGLIINIIIWIVLLSKFGFDKEPVPLQFNVVYGIDHVGPAWQIYQIPLVGLVVFLINWFLSKLVYLDQKLFSRFLGVTAGLAQLILLLASLSLILLNP